MSSPKIVILVPTYNEIQAVPKFIEAVRPVLTALNADLLFLDDDSPDGTGSYLKEQSRIFSFLQVLSDKRQGLGKAYLRGFQHALEQGYEILFQMDCDLSHLPTSLPALLEGLQSADFVIGSRYIPGGRTEAWPWHRKIVSRGGSFYARIMLGLPIHDLTGGFNGWRRSVLQEIMKDPPQSEGYTFQIEMKLKATRLGFLSKEIPIIFRERDEGKSKMSAKIVFEAMRRVTLWGIGGK